MKKGRKKKKEKFSRKKLKTIPPRLRKIMQRIKEICSGEGIPSKILKKHLKGIPQKESERALSILLKSKGIQMFTDPSNKKDQIFMTVSEDQARKYKGLGTNDIPILRLIEASRDRGMWLRHVKTRTRLPQNDVLKSISTLISKRLIKEVRTKKGRNRKVYMSYDIQPSSEVVGGVWYLKSKLNTELIEGVGNVICKKAKALGKVKVGQMLKLLKKNNPDNSKIQALREEHLQQVFDALMLDGTIEPVSGKDGMSYRVSKYSSALQDNAYIDIPCSTCPNFHHCTEKGNVSPSTCVYLKEWQQY